jgi:hypothetical protein
MLAGNYTLTSLNLVACRVSDLDAKLMISALKSNYSLVALNLRFNPCSSTATAFLAEASLRAVNMKKLKSYLKRNAVFSQHTIIASLRIALQVKSYVRE